jgi:cutinase
MTKGGTVGPALQGGLEGQIPDLWVQGVGGPYGATLAGNAARRGSPEDSIAEGVRLMQLANEKCPNSAVVAAGYRYVVNPFVWRKIYIRLVYTTNAART